jgi:tetratricopeptide (TPR) repeat protein
LQDRSTVRSLWGVYVAPRLPFFATFGLLLCAPLASASSGDHDPDQDESGPAPTPAPRAIAGKPVRFDRGWLTPFFDKGKAKQAVEEFRAEDWEDAETGFAKAMKSLPRDGGERHAAQYMVALARANQGKWNEAGQLFEELFKSYPKLAPYHAYNAARCRLRRGDAAGRLEWAGRVADGSVPKAEAELVRIDALRTLGRWSDALAALESYLQQWPNGPRRAESLFKKAEAMEKAAGGGGGVDARKAAPDVTAIYRRVWAEAPNDVWGDRAAERLEQIAASLPSAEAAVVRARTAGELMSRGMVLFDRNRNQESEAAFASALAAPGPGRRPGMPGAFPSRPVGLEAAPAPAGGAAVRRGRGRLRARREQGPAREGPVPGGAVVFDVRQQGNGAGALRACRGRARRPFLRRRRARPFGRDRDRRGRRGDRRQAARGGTDPLPQGRYAQRGAVAAGVCGLARGQG